MAPLSVIEDLDIAEDRCACLVACFEPGAVDAFCFERPEPAFHGRVVVTVALGAHGGNDFARFQPLDVIGAGILAAPVGMVNEARSGFAPGDGAVERLQAQLRPQMIVRCPAHDLHRCHVLDGRQIEPAFVRGHIGDVGEPDRIRPFGPEVLRQEIGRDAEIVPGIRGPGLGAAFGPGGKARLGHQPGHPLAAHRHPLGLQLRMDPRAPIDPARLLERRLDPFQEGLVLGLARALAGPLGPCQPVVKPAHAGADERAQAAHRMGRAFLRHEGITGHGLPSLG